MGTGYTRNDTGNNIADGNVINASDLDGEYNAIEAAFNASTGHTHDGTSAEGAPIEVVGPAQDLVVTAAKVEPKTDNTLDLGSSSKEFKDLYLDGTANIDSLVADTADINAGSIDGVTLGTNSAVTEAQVDNININGNTITSTDTNGNIALTPDGTGEVDISKVDIDSGTIDGATIATSDITVGAGKTLDVSAGTLTLANDQISGDKIDGGTIGTVTVSDLTATTADINGGTIDGVTIGGASAGAITGTTVTATGLVTAQDGLVVDNDGAKVATFDRATSDGAIVDFQRDGSAKGSIGVDSNLTIYIDGGSEFAGLQFGGDGSTEGRIIPRRNGALADGQTNLGNDAARFKNLFLSGGIHLGGTGSANYLDDYEEGTWTPGFVNVTVSYTSQSGIYKKVGNIVHCEAVIDVSSINNADTSEISVSGLPFAPSQNNVAPFSLSSAYGDLGSYLVKSASNLPVDAGLYVEVTANAYFRTADARGYTYTNFETSGILRVGFSYQV